MRTIAAVIILLLLIPAVHAQEIHTVAPGESLMHISLHYDVCVETILDANPDLKPRSIYAIETGAAITIPAAEPPCYPAGATTFPYTVEEFDSLYGLAFFYGVPIMSIVEASSGMIENPNLIEVGQVLNVPIATDERIDYTYFPFELTIIYGTFLDREALSAFAKRLNFDLRYVARWNDLPLDAYIARNEPIYVKREYTFRVRTADVPASYRRTYVAGWGDTYLGLALRYDASLEDLIEINHITNPNSLGQGRIIFIPEPTAADPPPIDTATATYTARWGDTLDSIAQAYSTLPQLIALVNNVPDPDLIDIGDTFSIPPHIRTSSGLPQIMALALLVPLTLLVTTRLLDRRKSKSKRTLL